MVLSKERLDELRKLMEEKSGETYTDEEVADAGRRLVGLAEICYDIAKRDWLRKRKLSEHPKGFHLDDGRFSCLLCGDGIEGENSWWDLLGQKCMKCQQAYWDGLVPSFVFQNHDSYYKMWELKKTFGINPQTARKMIREGKIKARIILTQDGKPHEHIFLKKENENLVTYERNHRYMSYECKCPHAECDYCLRVICLQKDCQTHPHSAKTEPRTKVIEELVSRKAKSMERVLNHELQDIVRASNLRSAEEEDRHIKLLLDSLGIGV